MGEESLKVNADKSKVIELNGEGGLEYEVRVDGIRLETVLEFQYLGVFSINQVQMRQSVVGGW